ncbi:MAG: AraC family transcriptional regulator [Pseudomonadota bacterium]
MLLSRPPKNRFLAPLIEAFWTCEADHTHELERVLPNGCVQLFVNLDTDSLHQYNANGSVRQRASGTVVQGPTLAPVVIDRAEQKSLCGVLFSPGGAFPFFRTPTAEIGPGLVDLECLSWGKACLLREQLLEAGEPHLRLDTLEAAFLEHAPTMTNWDAIVREATTLLRQGWRVRDLVNHFDTTPQTLITRFRERTGLTPKSYSQIERFQHLIRSLTSASSWADAAIDAGFSDQAHMVREFKRLSEITPTEYKPQSPTALNHMTLPT